MRARTTALQHATGRLAAAGVESPRREAELLLRHATGPAPRAADSARPIDMQRFEDIVSRRAQREPLAYITGSRGFWTLDLDVSPATLIPRPDSETLIEAALEAFAERRSVRRVLDLGTGTGCLLLAALAEFPAAFGVGVDLSPEAAQLAARNARQNGLADRAAFLAGDWAAALQANFDLILCNPPYISTGDLDGLMPEVALFEPRQALDGGPEGLDAYRHISKTLPALLAPGGAAILELGAGQAGDVARIARQAGLHPEAEKPDLGGVVRASVLRAR